MILLDGLDARSKQFIDMGMKPALGNPMAVRYHVPLSNTGSQDTILLTLSVNGMNRVAICLKDTLIACDAS